MEPGNTTQARSWNVSVTDEKARVSQLNLIETFVGENNTELPMIDWYFIVTKTSNSFTLNLPEDQKIDLTPIL